MLVKQRGALDEILNDAPLALNNLALTYNPQAGTLDTRANLGSSATRSRATRPPCSAASSARPTRPVRSATSSRTYWEPAGRAACGRLRRGRVPPPEQFDPTLGGLVEVAR